MSDLQRVFSKEFFRTEMNKIRGVDDMQFGFSYYYFLMNEMNNRTVGQIFDIIDTDGSGYGGVKLLMFRIIFYVFVGRGAIEKLGRC